MEKEPLLPFIRPTLSLHSLPEHDEITIPPSPSSKHLKDFLIFGPPPPSSSSASDFLAALALTLNSPWPTSQKSNLGPDSCPPASKNLHRSKTAPAMTNINEIRDFSEAAEQLQFGKQRVVRQGVVLLVIYLSLGVVIYSLIRAGFKGNETHPVVDALYFCIVTMCTIGYGDINPDSLATKLFSVLFVLVGFGFIDILLTGMVSYVLDLQENYLLRSINNSKGSDARSYIVDVKKGRMRIRMKVALALGVVVVCIGVGVAVMHFVERLDWVDSLYLSVMSVTTVGYGDRAFHSLGGRVFASVWLLVSTLAVARAFLYLAEARVDRRQRRMAKWVLDQHMTVAQFLAADIDNNGFVTKSEYAIYKLKAMGKISEHDVSKICQQFERLDAGNCGKISLVDLIESRH
ncbi:LOW QUALITY PROTEIN: two-pore potassium channel 3-like [Salvia splendens]|uniref:LOW QUALITY PROTEIN: two-pore potassium channel 3-like n=1 Tax=Salvia splendens TaxID=180675 RepID=UPI001C26D4D8|nr:LOW QUALITY PROTEIN: two-pore potassium channel 3-like [Salvia splendens]